MAQGQARTISQRIRPTKRQEGRPCRSSSPGRRSCSRSTSSTIRGRGRGGPGAAPASNVVVDCAVYCDGARLAGDYGPAAALQRVRELERDGAKPFVWIGLHEPDERQMEAIAGVFDCTSWPWDAVHAHQRPKAERYDDTIFMVLKTVNYVPHESVELAREIVETGEIMMFVGSDFVITVRHGEHTGLAKLRNKLEADPDALSLGPYG